MKGALVPTTQATQAKTTCLDSGPCCGHIPAPVVPVLMGMNPNWGEVELYIPLHLVNLTRVFF